MTHQEGQPEELVVPQARQEIVKEELLETVMGGGRIKEIFRHFCTNCIKPQTQEGDSHPSSPEASVRSSSPNFTIRSPSGRNLTQGLTEPLRERVKQHSVDFPENLQLPIKAR